MFQLPNNQENPFGIAKKGRTGISQLKLFAGLSEKLDVKAARVTLFSLAAR